MNKKAKEKLLKSITKQLIERYKPKKIILFGSAVAGELKPDSDFDFLVIKDNVPHLGVDRIRQVEKLIDVSWPCDFLVARSSEIAERLKMGDPFVKGIIKEGKVLYG